MKKREEEMLRRSHQPGEGPREKNINKSQITPRLPATRKPQWSQQPGDGGDQNSGVPKKKEAERIELYKIPEF